MKVFIIRLNKKGRKQELNGSLTFFRQYFIFDLFIKCSLENLHLFLSYWNFIHFAFFKYTITIILL
jgi:hypothetical protein